MKSNLRLVFGSDHCYICKPGTDKLVTLVEQGPLFYLPTKGRTDNNKPTTTTTQPQQSTSQSSTTSTPLDKTELYNTYIAPLEQQQEPRPTSWTDYWLHKTNCLVRVHKSARRKLFTPTDAELPPTATYDQLDGRRITHIKNYKKSTTAVHVDNFLTANANFRPIEDSWSGYTVFPFKQPTTHRATRKQQPPLQPQEDFNFSPDELLRHPPGLSQTHPQQQQDDNNLDTWTETDTMDTNTQATTTSTLHSNWHTQRSTTTNTYRRTLHFGLLHNRQTTTSRFQR